MSLAREKLYHHVMTGALLVWVACAMQPVVGAEQIKIEPNGPVITPPPVSDGKASYDGLGTTTRPASVVSEHSYVPVNAVDKLHMKLVDRVDCRNTDHGFQSDGNTTVEELAPGKWFRVTDAPRKKMYELGRMIKGKGKHEGKTYSREDYAPFVTPWFLYDLEMAGDGVYYVEAEVINDEPRHTMFVPTSACKENWFGNSYPLGGFGFYSGDEIPVDGETFKIGALVYPVREMGAKTMRVYVLSAGDLPPRYPGGGPEDGSGGAAVSSISLYKVAEPLDETVNPIVYPDGPNRRFGLFIPNNNLWHREFGYTGGWYRTGGEWALRRDYFRKAADECVAFMRYMGFNELQSMVTGDEAPTNYVHYPKTEKHFFPFQTLAQRFSEAGLHFSPTVGWPAGKPQFIDAFKERGIDESVLLMHVSGRRHGGTGPGPNAAHPEYRRLLNEYMKEVASKFKPFDSVDRLVLMGLFVQAGGWKDDRNVGGSYWGYSDLMLEMFQEETEIDIPENLLGKKNRRPVRNYLKKNAWEQWLTWRADKIRTLHEQIRDTVREVDERFSLTVSGHDALRKTPTKSWYMHYEDKTPHEVMLEVGYEPYSYAGAANLLIQQVYEISKERSWAYVHPFAVGMRRWNYDERLDDRMFRTREGNDALMAYGKWEVPNGPTQAVGNIKLQPGFTMAGPGRRYMHPILHALRTQNPYTMRLYNWQLATRGHEFEVREFARAYLALPRAEMVPLESDAGKPFEARWVARCGDSVVVINDSAAWPRIRVAAEQLQDQAYTEVVTGQQVTRGQDVQFQMRPYDIRVLVPTDR